MGPAHWRHRAEEVRRHAVGLADPVAHKTLLAIAQAYEQLALNAEALMGAEACLRPPFP